MHAPPGSCPVLVEASELRIWTSRVRRCSTTSSTRTASASTRIEGAGQNSPWDWPGPSGEGTTRREVNKKISSRPIEITKLGIAFLDDTGAADASVMLVMMTTPTMMMMMMMIMILLIFMILTVVLIVVVALLVTM